MKWGLHVIVIALLTFITQVGGMFYALSVALYHLLRIKRTVLKGLLVIAVYLIGILFVIPPLAKMNNRVAMPVFKAKELHIGPHTLFTVLANRHYVRPELKQLLLQVAKEVNNQYPGVTLDYMDGSFPLLKQCRMLPHTKHDDGTKLDVGYIRRHSISGRYTNRYFSFFGYGFSEKPLRGEQNLPEQCAEQGKWQYNLIEQVVPDQHWRKLEFPVAENAFLLKSIVDHPDCRNVCIEPHLKDRLGFSDNAKVKFLGCWAVRHDDHMHVQLKK
ncbi:MAG: hypothetical protein R2730_09395 [Chitinophagales bacterium]